MRRLIGLILPLSLAGAACGEPIDPVTGGQGSGATGFSVILTDDPTRSPGTGTATSQGPLAIVAEMEGSVRVSLRNDANGVVDLGVDRDVVLDLQGVDSVTLRNLQRPPTDTYVGILLSFEGVNVTVHQGSQVGDTVLTQNAVLGVGNGGAATLEIPTRAFDVASETRLRVVVDLNAERWITRNSLAAGSVTQATLSNNVTVEIP